jgi:hypothetical protein
MNDSGVIRAREVPGASKTHLAEQAPNPPACSASPSLPSRPGASPLGDPESDSNTLESDTRHLVRQDGVKEDVRVM